MGRPSIPKDIKDAHEAILQVMQDNLYSISENVIKELMKGYRKKTPSQRIKAVKDITDKGLPKYKAELLAVIAVISSDALKKVRKEVPKASTVKMQDWDERAVHFGEFEKLPPKIRTRLKTQVDLIVEMQKNDLDKTILFQFTSSVDSTDSESTIEYDLYDSAENFIDGNALSAGADLTGARAINEVRQAFFMDSEVQDQLDALMFMNDDPKTDVCIDLSNNGEGKLFSADDPNFGRFSPPLHFRCKSYIMPILKGFADSKEIQPLVLSNPAFEADIQFCDHAH